MGAKKHVYQCYDGREYKYWFDAEKQTFAFDKLGCRCHVIAKPGTLLIFDYVNGTTEGLDWGVIKAIESTNGVPTQVIINDYGSNHIRVRNFLFDIYECKGKIRFLYLSNDFGKRGMKHDSGTVL